ncbi:beta-ketoacyl-[acyl-carrier-protein] synthase family protein [Cryptosporangium arvum]|uniref:3-oxoacyl-[acyl-carrier-protein] synthase 2 n=1 Tax=Cryptosporangium arvum DSM 44712 TaxID=927661 RepID=A0A010ZUA8_9ACTN|nr:beta-ketoacyl-[acyl-carrier-protein] synthase II [Cryptosporangium arvum]EXG80772.1 3-oxoacyl-(acyl-carrier-protein) synthase [Cryptosporangium arvum DSM 44712]
MTERPSAEVSAAQAVSAASAPTGAGANVEVLVTGLGATTPLGGDVSTTWQAMLDGKSGVAALTDDWATDLPVRIAAKLAVEPTEIIERVKARRMDRVQQVAVVAAREAWSDAGSPDVDPERLAVVVGSGIGGALTLLGQWDVLREKGPRRVSPLTIPMLMPNGPAAVVGLEVGAKAAVRAPVSACATGAEAIAIGLELIRTGKADVVLAGGAEACIHPLPMAGFGAMRAMSTRNDEPERASRPFDKARDGFVLGEGGGMVVLERAEHARARGRSGYAVLAGAGITADGYDIVQPDPSGSGQARAVAEALADGGLTGADIQHVNGHSTSTPAGDMGELIALQKAIGDHPVVTATKSMTGHLLGAAGAVEAIATVLAIRDGVVPPTINLENPDDGVCLDIAANTARKMKITAAINDSFGFGGHNVALAFREL